MYDVIIIGGGLSGLSAAISCASPNCSVLVIEKGNLPRHKVCGEYLSAEVLPLFEHWGMDVSSRPLVKRALLSSPNGRFTEIDLPLGGIGISRYMLDDELHQLAIGYGADVRLQEPVRHVEKQAEGLFRVTTKSDTYKARHVVSCHGKTQASHLPGNEKSSGNKYLGVKQYYKMEFPKDLVALHSFRGGYGGAVLVEDGWVDMAFMIKQSVFSEYKSIEKVMDEILRSNPLMERLIDQGSARWKQPMAVSNFKLGYKQQKNSEILSAGDAFAMIPPASGNGMAMAIIGGAILGKTLRQGLKDKSSTEQIGEAYTKAWENYFRKRLWWGKQIQRLMEHPTRANAAMLVMKHAKFILRKTIRLTHGSAHEVKAWI